MRVDSFIDNVKFSFPFKAVQVTSKVKVSHSYSVRTDSIPEIMD
jgi:hypothetical protein